MHRFFNVAWRFLKRKRNMPYRMCQGVLEYTGMNIECITSESVFSKNKTKKVRRGPNKELFEKMKRCVLQTIKRDENDTPASLGS